MDYSSIYPDILTVLTIFAKAFGFILFRYPSQSFRVTKIGLILFIVNLGYSVYQNFGFLFITFFSTVYIDSIKEYGNSIAQVSILAIYVSSITVRIVILLLNMMLCKKIFKVFKQFEALHSKLNKNGVIIDYKVTLKKQLIIWIVKLVGTVIAGMSLGNFYVGLDFLYTIFSNYNVLDMYLAITRLVRTTIIGFKKKLMKIHQNNISNKPDTKELLAITSSMIDLIKCVNEAFGIQVFLTFLVLLLLGVISVFTIISGTDYGYFPNLRLILILQFVHFVLFEISSIGYSTYEEIKNIFAVLRKIYSKRPTEENLIFLDVNLEAPKYNCGFISFDWEIFKVLADPFFGFNVVYPTYAKVSSECIKASSSLISLPSKMEQILKISSKFSNAEYNEFTQSVMDLRFFFNGLHIFLQQYSDFINESPTSNPLKIITLLQYSAQLIQSATTQISDASKNFGMIFGQNLESAIDLLIAKYAEQVRNIRISLETLYNNFESILMSGADVNVNILDAEIDDQATADTLVAFQEITIASKQMTSVASGIISILQTLDYVVSKILESENAAHTTITALRYSLNLEIKSAKYRFSEHIKSNIDEIIQSFGDYSQTSHNVFYNVTSLDFQNNLHDQQKSLEDFGSQVSEMLWQVQREFSKRLQAYYDSLYKSIQTGQETIVSAVSKLKIYLSHLIFQNGGASFKKCFNQSSELTKKASSLILDIETEFTQCVNEERTLSLQIESLLIFIVEDVTLNIQGAFDNLCKCSVRGGSKILDQSKECIGIIISDLSTVSIKDDEKYLKSELSEALSTLSKSEDRFENCVAKLKESHEKAFAHFQQAALSCLVSQ